MELRIFDTVPETGNLVPIERLIAPLRTVVPGIVDADWLLARAVAGWGETVCQIEDDVAEHGRVRVAGPSLLPVLELGEEYFDTIDIEVCSCDVRFGVVDSTYLFVRGSNELIDALASLYDNVQVAE